MKSLPSFKLLSPGLLPFHSLISCSSPTFYCFFFPQLHQASVTTRSYFHYKQRVPSFLLLLTFSFSCFISSVSLVFVSVFLSPFPFVFSSYPLLSHVPIFGIPSLSPSLTTHPHLSSLPLHLFFSCPSQYSHMLLSAAARQSVRPPQDAAPPHLVILVSVTRINMHVMTNTNLSYFY